MADTVPRPEAPARGSDRLLVPRQQAADTTGLSLRTFERLVADGDGPPSVPIRGRTYYRLTDLEQWVASLRVDGEPAR